jgi:predicted HD superfamily hydrolase involved in NAD metabolism
VPKEVAHQFAGAYVAEKFFAVKDEDVLNAIRYHTSGRPRMSDLEKLIFLSDMLEEGRAYDVVDDLRYLFHHKSLNECLKEALFQTLQFLKKKNEKIYPLTEQAYEYVCQEQGTEV